MNTEIIKTVGVDLLKIRDSLQPDFENRIGYYDSLLDYYYSIGQFKFFDDYHEITATDKGLKIVSENTDSLIGQLNLAFAKSFKPCQIKTEPDSTCQLKKEYKKILFSMDKENIGQFSFSNLSYFVGIPHVKNQITNDEFSYLVIWMHMVISLHTISEKEYYKNINGVVNTRYIAHQRS